VRPESHREYGRFATTANVPATGDGAVPDDVPARSSVGSATGGGSGGARTVSASTPPSEREDWQRYVYPFPNPAMYVDLGAEGTECRVMTRDGALATRPAVEYTPERLEALGLDDPCAPVEASEGEGGGPGWIDPALVAMRLWQEPGRLPDPVIDIAPGRAITGLPAYLDIDGLMVDQVVDPPEVALGWTMVTDLTSSYEVDWGDGTVDTGITSQGGPYPDGDVWHDYRFIDKENVVTVTQRWTAAWTATRGGVTMQGQFPLYTQASMALPIWEVQAVVE
jgi:hypothetical protein